MQLVTSVGAHSRGEYVGAFTVAGDLAVVEISPISVTIAVVSGRSGMTCGVTLSATV